MFEPLLSEEDPKAGNIMNKLYIGKGATECDGDYTGFSTLTNILEGEAKRQVDEPDFYDMVSLGFEHDLEVDYSFQHCYRSKSISIYFMKDLFFGFIILMVSYIIWQDYLNAFRGRDLYVDTKIYPNGTITNKINSTYYEDTIYDFYLTEPV
jgi:hypothetical protein